MKCNTIFGTKKCINTTKTHLNTAVWSVATFFKQRNASLILTNIWTHLRHMLLCTPVRWCCTLWLFLLCNLCHFVNRMSTFHFFSWATHISCDVHRARHSKPQYLLCLKLESLKHLAAGNCYIRAVSSPKRKLRPRSNDLIA